jgi:hypothetical protein
VFATDGSYGSTEKDGIHGGEPKASRACVRHDRRVYGGVLPLADGIDNYIAEVEALVEALAGEPEGSSVIIVMDATSPVKAWARFHLCHARRKLQFREHARLDRTYSIRRSRVTKRWSSYGRSLTSALRSMIGRT